MNIKFGTKLRLKKDWERGHLTFSTGDIVNVAHFDHKYSLILCHPQLKGVIKFKYRPQHMEEKIGEYFDIIDDQGLQQAVDDLLEMSHIDEVSSHIKHITDSSNKLLSIIPMNG